MSDDLKSLHGTLEAVWRRIHEGVDNPSAPARNLILATSRIGGGGSARTIVLRGADREAGSLTFFTHRASSKVAELGADPHCEALIWDAASNLQIRLKMTAEMSEGPAEIWARFGPGTRRNYALSRLPGTPLETPEDLDEENDLSQFMVITTSITAIETLHLGRDLHRRAHFSNERTTWIAP